MTTNQEKASSERRQSGFTLLELMIAMAVTLVITGAMFAMVTTAQTSFRREPALSDRQLQIRIAMDRIQEDVLNAGINIGPFGQAFSGGLNGVGILGVRLVGDALLGGGNSDALELRSQAADCPSLRVASHPVGARATYLLGADELTVIASVASPCYKNAGWVLAMYLDGNAKFGWRNPTIAPAGFSFAAQPAGSQMNTDPERDCSLSLVAIAAACPLPTAPLPLIPPIFEAASFSALDVIRYQIALDTDGTPALFRSTTGGLDTNAGVFALPTAASPVWQLVARGIEDMQIRYTAGPPAGAVPAPWVNNAPIIAPLAIAPVVPTNFDNIVRQVEVTLWARTLGEARLQGETTAVGNGVTAVHGSLTTVIAPRMVEAALSTAAPTNANRWQ